jgi:hypothetical protein
VYAVYDHTHTHTQNCKNLREVMHERHPFHNVSDLPMEIFRLEATRFYIYNGSEFFNNSEKPSFSGVVICEM